MCTFLYCTLAWVPMAAVPMIVCMALILQRPLHKSVNGLFEQAGKKSRTLVESVSGLEVVKAFGVEGDKIRYWTQLSSGMARLGLRVRFLSLFAVNFAAFIQQLATVGVVVVGVYQIAAGALSMGGLIACTMLTARALMPLAQITSLITRYHQAMTGFRALDEVMQRPTERVEGKNCVHRPALTGQMAFDHVTFHYPDQPIDALTTVSFSLRAH